MKVLFIDGNNGNTDLKIISDEYLQKLSNKGVRVKTYYLQELDIKQCSGCCACMYSSPGYCVIRDNQEMILKDFISSDVVVILAPLCRGFIHSTTKRFLDRIFPLELPWVEIKDGRLHHKLRYSAYPKLGFIFHPENQTDKEDIEINSAYAKLVGDYYSGVQFTRTTEDGLEVLINETLLV